MKNVLLIIGVVFLSLNLSAQNGWSTEKSVITGQKLIYKRAISETGALENKAIKIWKEGDSYYFDVVFVNTLESFNSLRYYDGLRHEVRINGEWKTWWYGPMLKKTPIYGSRLPDIKAGDMLKIDCGTSVIYIDLSGSTAAINSL